MCYDISFKVHIAELKDYFPELIFDNQLTMEFGPIDHVQGVGLFAPYPIIYINRQDWKLHCRLAEWSVIPYDVTEEPPPEYRAGRLNIRSEKIFGDPGSYWSKIKMRRCLIPVTSIYEPRKIKGWPHSVFYNIGLKGQKIYFLPGLYSIADLPDKTTGDMKRWTFGMLTKKGEGIMKDIHNGKPLDPRMTVFLPFDMANEYVQEALSKNEKRYKEILDYCIEDEALDYHPVYRLRGNKTARPDEKDKDEYWHWENLPPLGERNPG